MGMFLFLRRLLSVVYLMTHPAVPVHLKVLPVLAFIYLVFPRDLWFDFRAFGFLDDFIVGGLFIGTFVNKGWARVLEAQRKRDETIPAEFRVINEDDVPSAEGAPLRRHAPRRRAGRRRRPLLRPPGVTSAPAERSGVEESLSMPREGAPCAALAILPAEGRMLKPIAVEPREGYRIWVRFNDGASGEVDLRRQGRACSPHGTTALSSNRASDRLRHRLGR